MNLPSCRRSRTSAPEEDEPRGEDPQTRETRVDQAGGAEVRRDLHRDEHLPGDDREHDADDDADQSRREERAQDVDGRREAASGDEEKARARKLVAHHCATLETRGMIGGRISRTLGAALSAAPWWLTMRREPRWPVTYVQIHWSRTLARRLD